MKMKYRITKKTYGNGKEFFHIQESFFGIIWTDLYEDGVYTSLDQARNYLKQHKDYLVRRAASKTGLKIQSTEVLYEE